MARVGYVNRAPQASDLQKQIVKAVAAAGDVPAGASAFFDKYVHDSHGGFWMLGPITKENRRAFIASIKEKAATRDRLLKQAKETGNPGRANNFRNAARAYELNHFERRVLQSDAQQPGEIPVLTDADAAELRDQAGIVTDVSMKILGTATRREPHGHGRFRRVFDKS